MNKMTLTKRLVLLTMAAAIGLLGGCAGTAAGQPAPESGQPESSLPPSEPAPREESGSGESGDEESCGASRQGAVPVADAAFHRGTVTKVETIGGVQAYTLTGSPGSGYGVLAVAFDSHTHMDFDPAQLAVGDQIEVYYSGLSCALDEKLAYVVSISAARLFPEEATNYNGILVEVTAGDKAGEGSLVMRSLGSEAKADPGEEALQEFVFHYSSETLFRMGLAPEELRPGDELNIYHRGVSTMSIPPQGFALEVRRMAEEAGELCVGLPKEPTDGGADAPATQE